MICGPPFDEGAEPAFRTPAESAVDADAAMSSTLSDPDGDGETGDVVDDSRLQASASDSAAIARHPVITRGNMRASPVMNVTGGAPLTGASSWGG